MDNHPGVAGDVPNLLVIGANGGIGRQTVQLALAAGYRVTALLRNPANLPLTHPNLRLVKGDIFQPETFRDHLSDKVAVISALGVKGTRPTTLYSRGNAILLEEMKRVGVRRVFFISASGIEVSPVQPFFIRLVTKYLLQKILHNMYADIKIMEQEIKRSGADWTIMRPPRLTNHASTGHYRVGINAFLAKCLSISRADVAHFMLNHIGDEATFRAIVEIAY